jgi:spermidine synthase
MLKGDFGSRDKTQVCIFTATIFLNAFLLFLIEPIVARMLQPLLGGAPAIWNTAMVFYQAALLGGYAYAHFFTRLLGVRRHALFHLILLAMAAIVLPIRIPAGWNPPVEGNPISWLILALCAMVGLPFLAISAGSPLLQRWFASAGHPLSADPYFLYSAGNLGSMIGLISYPVLVEPYLQLYQQRLLWALGYGALIVLMILCALFIRRDQPSDKAMPPPGSPGDGACAPIPARRRLRWIALAMVPSSLMLSATTYLTADIASIPLLWVIPLSIYLLSFILVFASRPLLRHQLLVKAMPILLLPQILVLISQNVRHIFLVLSLHLLLFFVIAMVCHGELAKDRPPSARLTDFYMLISFGGVLGGIFSALIAPALFNSIAEYPIMLIIACLLLPWKSIKPATIRTRLLDLALPILIGLLSLVSAAAVQHTRLFSGIAASMLVFGLPAVLCFSFSRRPLRFALAIAALLLAGNCYINAGSTMLHAERSFFGVIKIFDDSSKRYRLIMHGSTLHGGQSLDSAHRKDPLFYYHRSGPLGQIFQAFDGPTFLNNIAIVGLGAGSTASYARIGQSWTYYEIDPAIERIALDPSYFTYLHDCPVKAKVILGDARLSLSRAPDAAYNLLVLDAYSSDSIPVHLLTREALQLYMKKMAPGGVLVFHVSNRNLDLEPVLGNLARQASWSCIVRSDSSTGKNELEAGMLPSKYAAIARNRADLDALSSDPRWKEARTRPDLGIWTDDYSSILSIFRWRAD